MNTDYYSQKFEKISSQFSSDHNKVEIEFLKELMTTFGLSFQNLKILSEAMLDLKNWNEPSLIEWYQKEEPFGSKKQFWNRFNQYMDQLRLAGPTYQQSQKKTLQAHRFDVTYEDLKSPIFKPCPTTSEAWICCGLKVIDVVENCNLGCSYCILQDFYQDNKIRIAENPRERLAQVKLDPSKRYRITTGEYSDSLMWGNTGNILEELCFFAQENPNCILEMKTKSTNVHWILKNREKVPQNFVVSWSLNPPSVIANEEAATPSLDARLKAARSLANVQVKIGWHLHPILYFNGYEEEYFKLGKRLQDEFETHEVVAFSLGTLNFIKSQLQKIRRNVPNSKILRTPLKENGDNKWTYSDEIRVTMYRSVLDGMGEFGKQIPSYLCMEPLNIWQQVFKGFSHTTTESFVEEFTRRCFEQITALPLTKS